MLSWLFLLVILVQWMKIRSIGRGLDEIASQVGERLEGDTNNLLFLSTRDRHVRRLAAQLNTHLRQLRRQRQKYQSGDQVLVR